MTEIPKFNPEDSKKYPILPRISRETIEGLRSEVIASQGSFEASSLGILRENPELVNIVEELASGSDSPDEFRTGAYVVYELMRRQIIADEMKKSFDKES